MGLEEGPCGCCPCWLLPLCCAPSELVGRARGARGALPAPFAAPLLLLPEPLFSLPCAAPLAAAAA